MPGKSVNVLEYTSFRQYLNDWLKNKQKTKLGLSLNSFMESVGIADKEKLSKVIHGKANINKGQVIKISKVLKHNPKEKTYFACLVNYERADRESEKKKYSERLMKMRGIKNGRYIYDGTLHMFSHWVNVPVCDLLYIYKFTGDIKDLKNKFVWPVSEQEIKNAIDTLVRLGMIKKVKDGDYALTNQVVETGQDKRTDLIRNNYKVMIKKGAQAIEKFPIHEREFQGATVSCSEKCFESLRNHMRSFMIKMDKIIQDDDDDKNGCRVYQFNMHMFPLTKLVKTRGPKEDELKCKF